MKRVLILLLVFFTYGINAQDDGLSDKQKRLRDEEIAKRKAEYISQLMTDLKIDEFQAHILRQRLDDYFEEKIKIAKAGKIYYERNQEIQDLDATYFEDLKESIPEDVIEKIKERIKSGETKFEDKKKKKKKRKKKDKQ